MKINKIIWILFLFIVFLAGLFAIFSLSPSTKVENMENKESSPSPSPSSPSCPDMLIQNGNILLLYNSNIPVGNGINPIPFASLDEYIQYVRQQRSQGIDCPVLFLQQENNAQGQNVYRIRPSPFDLQGGLPPVIPPMYSNESISSKLNQYYSGVGLSNPIPTQTGSPNVIQVMDASRENGNYNTNQYAGFDPQGLYVGMYTNIDQIHDSTSQGALSDNQMDPNWGGIQYTNQSLQTGKYAENNISRPLLFQPKGQINANIQGMMPPPQDII